jgi:hypothetical protein
MPALHRYVGNPVLSRLGRLFFKVPVHDFHCGIRGFRRDRIEELHLSTRGMEFATEMVVKSALHGLEIWEVPTTLRPDGRSRAPHLKTWRDGWRHLRFLLALSPRWLFLYPSIALLLVGLAGILTLAAGPVRIGTVTFDIQSMLAAGCVMIVGLQLGALALVARAYATRLGLLPVNRRLEILIGRFTLEWGVIVGVLIGAGGVALFLVAALNWQRQGFGPLRLETIRLPVIGMILIVAGAQTVALSFMLSMTRIGEG